MSGQSWHFHFVHFEATSLIVFSREMSLDTQKQVNTQLSGQECMVFIEVNVTKQHERKSSQKRLWVEKGGDWRSRHVAVDRFPADLLARKQIGWQCRRSSSREESNHLSFQRSLRRVAIACWSCPLEQADGSKSVWSPHRLCLSRVSLCEFALPKVWP